LDLLLKRLHVSLPLQGSDPVLDRLEKHSRRLRRQVSDLKRLGVFWSWLRLGVFLLVMGLSLLLFLSKLNFFAGSFLSLGLVGFGGIVRIHQKYQKGLYRRSALLRFLSEQRMRRKRAWETLPLRPLPTCRPEHPYVTDLDILGKASLHHLADTSISQEGCQKLADWFLVEPPGSEVIHQRQNLVKALKERTLFRHGLFVKAQETAWEFRHQPREQAHWKASELLELLKKFPPKKSPQTVFFLLIVLAAVHGLVHGLAWAFGLADIYWQIPLGIYALVFWLQRGLTTHLFQDAFLLDFEVRKLSGILSWLENWAESESSEMRRLLAVFRQYSPQHIFKALRRVVPFASLQTNPIAWILMNLFFPFDYFAAWQLEKIKPELQAALPLWLEALSELEALSSLANLAWLHPEYHFPVLQQEGACLNAQAAGHPLLSPAERIKNSFVLDHLGTVCMVTGSNMAGKSTFIKSMGLNLVLAQAGGPVDADAFAWRLMRVFACIRVSDSVTDGFSYFYAEVRRLRQLLDQLSQTEGAPLFWLIDEIFRGTNNRERYLGSKAYLENLLGKRGAGLITTHDLELTHIAAEELINYHFREHIEAGKMVFDYRLQSGPCPTTNALKIMALEGLPVPESILDTH